MTASDIEQRRAELVQDARVKRALADQARALALQLGDETARLGLLSRHAELEREAAELEALAAVLAEAIIEGRLGNGSSALQPPLSGAEDETKR